MFYRSHAKPCDNTFSELFYPLVPLYLASVLLAGPRALGLIEGIAEATASLLKLFSGVLIDQRGYGLWQAISPFIAFGFSASCALLAALLLKFWVIRA